MGYVTKSLLELGLSARFVSYAWLAGPIAGVLVQPTVGVLSDRCTARLGRRRPFLIAGTVVTVLSLLIFAYAREIGEALGDLHGVPVKTRALFVAIVSFWTLDFAINAAQGPLRALLADVLPVEQHAIGNAYFAFATGLGNCLGSLLGSVSLSTYLLVFPHDLAALYTIAVLFLVLTMAVTVVGIKEIPLEYSPLRNEQNQQSWSFFKDALVAPSPFFEAFTTQCFSWFGWFTLFVFGTSWVGSEVYNGSFSAAEGTILRKRYDEGVRMGNLGIGLQSVITILCALSLPALMRRTSRQAVYFTASILLACALSATLLLHHRWQAWIAVALFTSTGFAWAVTMTVPWSLMSEAVARAAPEKAGVYFTMFNLSQCLPEIVVSLVAEEVERLLKSQAAVLGLGGASVFLAAVLIIVLRVGKPRVDRGDQDEYTALAPMSAPA